MRQSDLIATRSRVSDAEDMLKTLLDLRDEDVFTSKRIEPVDRPKVAPFEISDIEKGEEAVKQSIAVALEKRPEMLLSEIEIANAKLDIDRTADGMLPEFNLTGSVSQGGRDHKVREVFNDVRERTDNAYTVGFRGSVPIGNRIARGTYERALLTQRQAEQRREQTKQELMLKVRLASRAAYTSQILVESNRQARALQETNVVAEEKRLRLGVSTSYRVLQIQEDLTAAQTQELQAQIAYEKALVEVRLAEGTILDHLGIEFGMPENEKSISYVDSVKPDWKPVATVSGWIDDIGCKESCEEGATEPEAPASDQPESPAPVEEAPAEG
jgi:outer membrane protein TolC